MSTHYETTSEHSLISHTHTANVSVVIADLYCPFDCMVVKLNIYVYMKEKKGEDVESRNTKWVMAVVRCKEDEKERRRKKREMDWVFLLELVVKVYIRVPGKTEKR